jgi:FtsP/CotA-like multicopper oxidase with cupredoxin domain
MRVSVRSKKMRCLDPLAARQNCKYGCPSRAALRSTLKMVGNLLMARPKSPTGSDPDRRSVLAGLAATASLYGLGARAASDAPQRLALRALEATNRWQWGDRRPTPLFLLRATPPVLRFKPGLLVVAFQNDLPMPATLDWCGVDGSPAAEPLTAQPPLAPGTKVSFTVTLRRPGTFLCSLRPLEDASARPCQPIALVVEETEPPSVDRDEVMLIEEWRLRADGTAAAPGTDPKDTETLHTINESYSSDLHEIPVRANQRFRYRFINCSPRTPLAVKFEGLDVRIMAIDSQPAEPFSARNGALVMAPGSRVDAFVDVIGRPGLPFSLLLHDGKQARRVADFVISDEPPVRTAPLSPAPALPSDGLPEKLDLKNALRVDLPLAGPEWTAPASFAASAAPAFRAKAGRTVVLALVNRGASATTFHLHGHHFRLLDRLDDGWKPFWLDTLAVEPGQTQRIAFAADYAGRFLIEQAAADWAAPRLVRWYGVE